MSRLDFANYFLSNQRLHAWSWINRTSLGDGFFWWVFRLLIFLDFSFSVFVWREASKSPTHRILVGDQREKTTLGCGFLSFFIVYLVTILYCSDIVWSKDLSAHFFCFLDQELSFLPFSSSFFTFPRSLIGNFLSFLFAFSHSLIGNFLSPLFLLSLWLEIFLLLLLLPRVRIDILTLGQGLWWVRILAQGL